MLLPAFFQATEADVERCYKSPQKGGLSSVIIYIWFGAMREEYLIGISTAHYPFNSDGLLCAARFGHKDPGPS